MGGVWRNRTPNFDNIFEAMITLFIISSLEGWPTIMFNSIDSGSEDEVRIELTNLLRCIGSIN